MHGVATRRWTLRIRTSIPALTFAIVLMMSACATSNVGSPSGAGGQTGGHEVGGSAGQGGQAGNGGGGQCSAGFGDCDANLQTGCETDLSTNSQHCGACNIQVDDENPCTDDICMGGQPVHSNVAVGTSCGANGQCNANGGCIPCANGDCSNLCLGQVNLASFPSLETPPEPNSLATADFNGDGYPDFVAGSLSYGFLSLFYSVGAGKYAPRTDMLVPDVTKVATGDVDADGKIDIVTANASQNTVSVLRNLGNGTFAAKVDYFVSSRPQGIVVVDLNGDGKVEITTANDSNQSISLLMNQGDGTFAPRVDYPAGAKPVEITASDVNGDGLKDLLVVNADKVALNVFMNQGNGTFAPRVDYSVVQNTADFGDIVAADLDGDGDSDVAVMNYKYWGVFEYLNQGDGTFAAPFKTNVPMSGNQIAPWPIDAADFTGDGKIDLVVGDSFAGLSMHILENGGNAIFTSSKTYELGNGPSALVVTDIEKDGKPDIVVANTNNYNITLLRNNGGGNFNPAQDLPDGSYGWAVAAADFDGDGKLDIVHANLDEDTISLWYSLGNGNYTPRSDMPVGDRPYALQVDDLNGDGKPDIVVGNTMSKTVTVYLNQGSGTFAPRVDLPIATPPQTVRLADLNNDQLPDLIVPGASMFVMTNLGNGSFGPANLYTTNGYVASVTTLDANGDNLLDIVYVPGSNADYLSMGLLINQGNMNFTMGGTFPAGGGYTDLAAADVDRDGLVDAIATHNYDDPLTVMRNLGNGNFGSPVPYPVGRFARFVVPKDMNGDGWVDLVTSSDALRSASLLLNNGNGTFAPFQAFAIDVTNIALEDMNADGKPDVVCSKRSTPGILFNNCGP